MINYILVSEKDNIRVPVGHNEILYITIAGKYSRIKLKTGKEHLVRRSLKDLEHSLSPDMFCRVHKKYIVSLLYIKRVELDVININGGYIDAEDIPLGREYKDAFLGKFILA